MKPATKQVLVRTAVADLYAQGVEPSAIARSIDIPIDRVEEILDFLDSHPGYDEPSAVIYAVPDPAPAHTTQPGPEPVKASPEPVRPSPEPVTPAERPAARLVVAIEVVGEAAASGDSASATSPKRTPPQHGTYSGYMKHAQSKELPGGWSRKPCEPCAESKRQYQRDRKARVSGGGGLLKCPA